MRSFKILNVCMVLKNHYHVHVKGGKSIFVPRSDNMCICTEILDSTMQKVSPDSLMIIWHKSNQIIYLFGKIK